MEKAIQRRKTSDQGKRQRYIAYNRNSLRNVIVIQSQVQNKSTLDQIKNEFEKAGRPPVGK